MQRQTGELRQARKGATVARICVCRRVPGLFLYGFIDVSWRVRNTKRRCPWNHYNSSRFVPSWFLNLSWDQIILQSSALTI